MALLGQQGGVTEAPGAPPAVIPNFYNYGAQPAATAAPPPGQAPMAPPPPQQVVQAPTFAQAPPGSAGAPIIANPTTFQTGTNDSANARAGSGYNGYANQWMADHPADGQAANANKWSDGNDEFSPWLTRGQAAQTVRNDYYYGGSAGGANAFNAQVGATGAQAQGQYGAIANQATQGANGAYANQFAAQSRNPGQFLDQTSIGNSGIDRSAQLHAAGQLNATGNAFTQLAGQPEGPSAAQAQLNMATDANMGNALALARSGRGMGQSQAGLRQAIGQNALTQQQAGNQSAMLRAQETQAYKQNQLAALGGATGAYGQGGGLAGQARAGDISQASYMSGTQQANQNANDQAGVQYGSQAIGYGQLGLGAVQGNAATQMAALGLQNNVNSQAQAANQNYQNYLMNRNFGTQDRDHASGTDYTPLLAAGGAVLGGLIGGPGGAAAGGAVGNGIGQATR